MSTVWRGKGGCAGPAGLAGTRRVMQFIARELSPDTYVNLMNQYHPCYQAAKHTPLHRRITGAEFDEAVAMAQEEGLCRLDGIGSRHSLLKGRPASTPGGPSGPSL